DLEAFLLTIAPPTPAPAEARPWTPVFDGKSLDFLVGNGEGSWAVENGSLVHVKGKKTSAQTKQQYGDGEFRIRFENRQLTHAGFSIRQGETFYGISLNRQDLDAVGDRDHELIAVFRGHHVRAFLDGKPWKVEANGKPLRGPLQFNGYGEFFVIKLLEFREPSLSDGLVGYWTLDSVPDGKVNDYSGSKNDGKALDGAVLVPGKFGSALQFNGRSSRVSVPSSPSLNPEGPLTI